MSDAIEDAFIEAIRKNPDDDEARGVYADWLEERGDLRGEYLRLEGQLHRIPARLDELARAISPNWLDVMARRYDVLLVSCGPNKIATIKSVRAITGLGLKDAKDIADNTSERTPQVLRQHLNRAEARPIIAELAGNGATVQLVPHLRDVTAVRGYELDLVLMAVVPDGLIPTLKLIRELLGIGIKDAKDIVDRVVAGERCTLARNLDATRGAELVARFAGVATVVLEKSYVRTGALPL